MKKALPFEGTDIMAFINNDAIVDDELTKGRIRTIYTQLRYGTKKAYEIAEYYDLPLQLVKDIRDRKIFQKITSDL